MHKTYRPKEHEEKIYRQWQKSGFFNPDQCLKKDVCPPRAPVFSMVLPPPNVTGVLHMGHAIMLALEDVMVRYHRMSGERTLWLPGTDHAAIATQAKVEGLLYQREQKTRHDLGRAEFLRQVEQFARASHDSIVEQIKRMGSSVDWSREVFTLDEARSRAVRTAFKRMYDDGLVYRGPRIVNWDPALQSTVSDEEVEYRQETGQFYYLKYGPFVIGTARPETKFGDKYVLMHPQDKRYRQYQSGDTLELEWINGPIRATVIKDEAVDREFGTGVMTITPWHDATDFEIAERHRLDKEQIIGYDGRLLSVAGEFAGQPIEKARPAIVAKLKAKGLLVKVDKNYVHNLAVNSRGGGLIEPQIMTQWFVDVNKKFKLERSRIKGIKTGQAVTLKQLMRRVVESGQIEIIPRRFEKVYFHWIDNLRDWCISRQIWYGHRLPVWYHKNSKMNKECAEPLVRVEPAKICPGCRAQLRQDPDTLDTWFSSALWTFSTLGWPEKTADFKTFHPTSVLETGYDILFFWVAKMIMMTTYLLGEIPFEKVYLHGLVRDERGRKMTKSLGNTVDPTAMIDKYGADALRLSLLIGQTPGNDLAVGEEKIEGYRNFVNKLWNVARFLEANGPAGKRPLPFLRLPDLKQADVVDRWLLAQLGGRVKLLQTNFTRFRFGEAAQGWYDFLWHDLADWYIESVKAASPAAVKERRLALLDYALGVALTALHPFAPFVTEAIYQRRYRTRSAAPDFLMIARLPRADAIPADQKARALFELARKIVVGVRSLRSAWRVPPKRKSELLISAGQKAKQLTQLENLIARLTTSRTVVIGAALKKPVQAAVLVVEGVKIYLPLAELIDVAEEKTRIKRELRAAEQYQARLKKQLKSKTFRARAPARIVQETKERLTAAEERSLALKQNLKAL